MDAVKFVQDYIRLCAQQEDCNTCPIYGIEGVDFCTAMPNERSLEGCEKLVTLTNAWAIAHPTKTRQDAFLEQWPNAKVFADGVLDICPNELDEHYLCKSTDIEMRCQSCRRDFWMKEVK